MADTSLEHKSCAPKDGSLVAGRRCLSCDKGETVPTQPEEGNI